jgi:23S rRNA pseudouridine2457 synthase
MLIAFNKPFGVVSQFTEEAPGRATLAQFSFPPSVYPLGRLDVDSEGLLLLSDEPKLNALLLHPRERHERRYWAQVERIPSRAQLDQLSRGVRIPGHQTLPCRAWMIEPQPTPPPREPPVRFRKTVPTCWIALELVEGKNRQVRRMTASIGFPTLRLIRVQIGRFALDDLPVGHWKTLSIDERKQVFTSDRAAPEGKKR